MAAENNLGKDKVSRLVWRIAIPSMLGQFVSVLYSIVDRMYIGNIPEIGDVALAGVGVCGPVVTMVGSVAVLVGVGGAPLVSIRMGEERPLRRQKGAGQLLFDAHASFRCCSSGGSSPSGSPCCGCLAPATPPIPSLRSTSPPTCAAPFSPWRPAG